MPSSLFGRGAAPAAPATASRAVGGLNSQILQVAQSAKRMMGMLQAVKNPQSAIMQAEQQNPQLGAVMQMCQGRNPQEVFMEECRKHGVDPNAAMQQIHQLFS